VLTTDGVPVQWMPATSASWNVASPAGRTSTTGRRCAQCWTRPPMPTSASPYDVRHAPARRRPEAPATTDRR